MVLLKITLVTKWFCKKINLVLNGFVKNKRGTKWFCKKINLVLNGFVKNKRGTKWFCKT